MGTSTDVDLERYAAVTAGTLGHFRTDGFMDVEIQSLFRPVHILGRALTVSCQPTDNGPVGRALAEAQAGDVLVIDRQGDRRHACWGGILSRAAQAQRLGGVVIDGAATDWREINELRFPVYCRALSALTTRRLELEGSVGSPISCGGVQVRTGDIILADDDGVVVVPHESASSILNEALAREAREERMRQWLLDGMPLAEARDRAAGS